jgi:hypothetical protein
MWIHVHADSTCIYNFDKCLCKIMLMDQFWYLWRFKSFYLSVYTNQNTEIHFDNTSIGSSSMHVIPTAKQYHSNECLYILLCTVVLNMPADAVVCNIGVECPCP